MKAYLDLDGALNVEAEGNHDTLLLKRWREDFASKSTPLNLTWKTEEGTIEEQIFSDSPPLPL